MMVALFVQTLMLMAAAYFVGAALACLVRRALHRPAARPVPVERRVDPLPDASGPAQFARSTAPAPRPASQPVPGPAPAQAAALPAAAQDLKRIRRIDGETEAGLNRLGVLRYEQIAAWKRADVIRIGKELALGRRISCENWIEQAQVLAKGGETHYAARQARGEAPKAEPTPDEGEPRLIAPPVAAQQVAVVPRASTAGAAGVAVDVEVASGAGAGASAAALSAPEVSTRAAFAQRSAEQPSPSPSAPAAAMPEPAVPLRPAAPAARDNLQRISGVDADVEAALLAQGVSRYSQIAHWSPADVQRFDIRLGGAGRIARENWIEQAQILGRGGDTAFSREYDRRARGDATAPRPAKLADAIREHSAKSGAEPAHQAQADLTALRSVRSDAHHNPEPGPEAARRAAAHNKVPRSPGLDDLKRIRGIGVLIEKKLNSMGVVAYEQIANWTAGEIERISQSLDFKGRIERENWVEQARILASGGATEFSRRVDRGEVETSRYRQ